MSLRIEEDKEEVFMRKNSNQEQNNLTESNEGIISQDIPISDRIIFDSNTLQN